MQFEDAEEAAPGGRAPGEPPPPAKGLPKMEPRKGAVGSWARRREAWPARARRGGVEGLHERERSDGGSARRGGGKGVRRC